ncbi:hypothetical protein [Streptomyces sp. TP-A0874]|nr:hypothetical protein [Streptomyces sp. TP-A0874]
MIEESEAVLQRPFGGGKVRRGQLERLLLVGENPVWRSGSCRPG